MEDYSLLLLMHFEMDDGSSISNTELRFLCVVVTAMPL